MGFIKKFLQDRGRVGTAIVCLLVLSVVMVSSITGETLAASEMCLQCNNNSSVIKIGTSINPDENCTVSYKQVDPSVCGLETAEKTLTVKFKLNNGDSISGSTTKSCLTTTTSCSVTGLPTATRTGYDFKGWGVSSSCTAGVTEKITLYASTDNYTTNYYACWVKKTYTVKYDANGGSGAPANQSKKHGEDLTLSTTKPIRSNYTFLGWNTNPIVNTVKYKSGAILSTNADVTLYAVWGENNKECFSCRSDKNLLKWKVSNSADSNCSAGYDKAAVAEDYCQSYLVKYDANGGSGAPTNQYKAKGVALTLSSTKPTRTGYTFKGWNTKSNGTGTSVSQTYTVDAATVLYAVWDENGNNDGVSSDYTTVTHKVTIKYNPNGGVVTTNTTAGTWKVVNNLIYKNDSLLKTTIDYGSKLGANGLIDYYSGVNLQVIKTGYDAIDGAEWVCLSGACTPGKTFNQTDAYSHSDFCDASNGDCEVVLGVNWNTSKVIIKYNTNGGQFKETTTAGTWTVANDALHLNNNLHTTTIHYGSKLGENGLTDYNSLANLYITKTGHVAKSGAEWVCAYGACEVGKTFNQTNTYSDSDFCDASKGDCIVVLGVNWIPNKVNIHYNPNGGTVTPSTDAGSWTVVNNLIHLDGNLLKTTVDYGSKLGENGLVDYYSGVNLKVTRKGYDAKLGAQWVCLSGACTPGKTFDYSTLYSHSDFCDASNGDCTVVLGVNWQANKYTIKYNGNGNTSGSTESSTHEYDISKKLTANGYIKTGYTFNGWNTKADGSGTSYTEGQSVKNLSSTNGVTVNLYAQWKVNEYTVKYNANGGIGTMSDSTYTYGVSKNLTANSFTRADYTFKCWNTKADGSGINYTDKQNIKITENLTLYAQWKSNDSTEEDDDANTIKYYVRYDSNGGTGTMKDSEHTYGYASNLSKNTFTRTGYTFKYWNTKADGTGTTYIDGQTLNSNLASTNGEVVTLYAQWLENSSDNGDDSSTTPGTGNEDDNSSNGSNQGDNNNIDESPKTGMLATILVSLIGLGALGGVIYYRKKVKI